jgi:hypothetical protein
MITTARLLYHYSAVKSLRWQPVYFMVKYGLEVKSHIILVATLRKHLSCMCLSAGTKNRTYNKILITLMGHIALPWTLIRMPICWSWSSGSCVQISVQRLTILTDILCDLPQSFQANVRVVPQIRPHLLPSTNFPIPYSIMILQFNNI